MDKVDEKVLWFFVGAFCLACASITTPLMFSFSGTAEWSVCLEFVKFLSKTRWRPILSSGLDNNSL